LTGSPEAKFVEAGRSGMAFHGRIGQPYILYTSDVAKKDNIVFLPIYMAMFL
jgi:hypothetical protein